MTRLWLLCSLLQMALARSDSAGQLFSGPVVVLSDKQKEEMDEIVRTHAAAAQCCFQRKPRGQAVRTSPCCSSACSQASTHTHHTHNGTRPPPPVVHADTRAASSQSSCVSSNFEQCVCGAWVVVPAGC